MNDFASPLKKIQQDNYQNVLVDENSPQSAQYANVTPRTRRQRPVEKTDEKDKLIEKIRNENHQKDSEIEAISERLKFLEDELRRESFIVHRKHPMTPMQHVISDQGSQSKKVGRSGSLATSRILDDLPDETKSYAETIAKKFEDVFNHPVENMSYLSSAQYALDLLAVCTSVSEIFEMEPRCIFMQSPVYVFGDIHGNLEDLHFFSDNIWKFGIQCTAGKFLFLGDYVDRGRSSVECITYLFCMKVLHPRKVFLLRGNHETRDVNGWEDHYKDKSFIAQCKDRFGTELGTEVWEEVNKVFDRLPLSAVIDYDIFCTHGGIPRPTPEYQSTVQAILAVPHVSGLTTVSYANETNVTKQVAIDCLWSDPASEDQETCLDQWGFGESSRGGGAACFGMKAITDFLDTNNLSFIIRAHEAHAHGVSIAKAAKVLTVFSTSQDHNQGSHAMAGCVLVDVDNIQVITRSPSYRNKYVHRRSSSCLHVLSEEQLAERSRLGLIRGNGVPRVPKARHISNIGIIFEVPEMEEMAGCAAMDETGDVGGTWTDLDDNTAWNQTMDPEFSTTPLIDDIENLLI